MKFKKAQNEKNVSKFYSFRHSAVIPHVIPHSIPYAIPQGHSAFYFHRYGNTLGIPNMTIYFQRNIFMYYHSVQSSEIFIDTLFCSRLQSMTIAHPRFFSGKKRALCEKITQNFSALVTNSLLGPVFWKTSEKHFIFAFHVENSLLK